MSNEQVEHCESILRRFGDDFRAKYQRGQIEHGGNMWEKSGMIDHAIEEAQDLVAYLYTEKLRSKRPTAMPVVYVAGPFRGPNSWAIEENIRRAEALALEVWRLGCAALCPHTNTRFFQGAADDNLWLEGDLVMLSRCDAIILTPDWAKSTGASSERLYAIQIGLPVFESVDALRLWKQRRDDPS